MANNVTLPGAGTVVAADDISGVQYQRVKLVDGTEDGTGSIPGDATNGLDVDVTRVQGTVTVDTELPSATALADAEANPTAPRVGAMLMGRNPNDSNWYRLSTFDGAGDDLGPYAQYLAVNAFARGYDPLADAWARLRVDAAKNLLVSLNTLLSGEDTTNNRILTDVKPASTDSVLEILQNAATATGNGSAASVKGYKSLTLEVTGTWVGTVTFEGTIDDSSWFTVALTPTTAGTPVTSTTANGAWKLPYDVALSQLRARVTWTSGTSVTVKSRKHPR